jgi:hypothetical protein
MKTISDVYPDKIILARLIWNQLQRMLYYNWSVLLLKNISGIVNYGSPYQTWIAGKIF